MNQGVTKKRRLWSKAGEKVLRELPLAPWTSRRREDLFKVREMLNAQIDLLDQAVMEVAEKNEKTRLLMTQPGVGPITSMAFVLTMGDVKRFQRGKQVASYLGRIPREYSSGGHQRFGSISKQGNWFMRMLLVEAAQNAVRYDPGFRMNICIAATTKQKEWRKWQRRGNWRFDSTGCCAPIPGIQGSFVSRAARGCRWSAQARPRDWCCIIGVYFGWLGSCRSTAWLGRGLPGIRERRGSRRGCDRLPGIRRSRSRL